MVIHSLYLTMRVAATYSTANVSQAVSLPRRSRYRELSIPALKRNLFPFPRTKRHCTSPVTVLVVLEDWIFIGQPKTQKESGQMLRIWVQELIRIWMMMDCSLTTMMLRC